MKSTALLNLYLKLTGEAFLFLFLFSFPFPLNAATEHLMITAVQIAGENLSQDYLKIYNPFRQSINLSGYHLRKRTYRGKEYSLKVFPSGTILPPHQFLTWANSQNNFAQLIQADYASRATLSRNNSVALLNKRGEILDAVAWGHPQKYFGFGKPFPDNPPPGQHLERKRDGQNFIDSNNDAVDFFLINNLTSWPITDNLNSEQSSFRLSSKGLTFGLEGSLALLSLIFILIFNFKEKKFP